MFAPSANLRSSNNTITSYLDPNSDALLKKFFFPSTTPEKKRNNRQLKQWSDKASLPPGRHIEGLGRVSTHRDTITGGVVRVIQSNAEKFIRRDNKVIKQNMVKSITFQPVLTSSQNLNPKRTLSNSGAFPLKKLSSQNGDHFEHPDETDEAVINEVVVKDYVNSVNRISVPSNFIKSDDFTSLSKKEVEALHPNRIIYKPNLTIRDANGNVKLSSDENHNNVYYIESLTQEERLHKKIKPPTMTRPSSAPPIRNLISSQKAKRDELSTPKNFIRLGAEFVHLPPEQVKTLLSQRTKGKRHFRMLKKMVGDRYDTGETYHYDEIKHGINDTEISEWCVERVHEPYYKIPEKLELKGKLSYVPKRENGKANIDVYSLNNVERKKYLNDRYNLLSLPKSRYTEDTDHVYGYARDDNDVLAKKSLCVVGFKDDVKKIKVGLKKVLSVDGKIYGAENKVRRKSHSGSEGNV